MLPEPTTDPTRFFVLENSAAGGDAAAPATSNVIVGLLPIEVPAYLLDHRALAFKTADNEIRFRDFDRWAEPLDEGIARLLRDGLEHEAGIGRVLVPPFPLQPARTFDLQVRVLECTAVIDGNVRFILSYQLVAPDGKLHRQGVYSSTDLAWNGESADLARQLSAAVVAAARTIASEV